MNNLSEIEKMSIVDRAWNHSYQCTCEICAMAWVLVGPDGGEPGNFGPFDEETIRQTAKSMGEAFPEGWVEDEFVEENEDPF